MTSEMRTLYEIFPLDVINKCIEYHASTKDQLALTEILEEKVMDEYIQEINEHSGQANQPRYLAYLMIYALDQVRSTTR